MNCENCGTEILEIDNKKICPNCGLLDDEMLSEEKEVNYIG